MLVVQVQLRVHADQLHVRLPERIHGSHVAPVTLRLGLNVAERVTRDSVLPDQSRQDILGEIVAGGRRVGVLDQPLEKELSIKYVNPHRSQRHVFPSGQGFRFLGLFREPDHLVLFVHREHAKLASSLSRHLDAADRDIRLAFDVVGQHRPVIHFVDVIPGQNQHEVGFVGADDIQILVDGVGGPPIPRRLVDALLGRQQLHEFPEFAAQETPAALDVLDQGMRLVLGQHANPPDSRIDAVGQRKIDDPILSAEGGRRFGAPQGELFEPAAAATGEDQREGLPGQATDKT